MSIWEMVTLWGLTASILGVFLTFYGIINNKTLKKESQSTRDILERIEKRQDESRQEFRKTMDRMESGRQESHKETLKVMQENHKEAVKVIERITEKIAELIVDRK